MISPKIEMPKELLDGLYRPEYRPIIDNLNEAKFDPAAILEQVEREIESKIEEARKHISEDRPQPLSSQESEAFERQLAALRQEISRTRTRIGAFKEYIHSQAQSDGGSELGFTLETGKKIALNRAIKALFGKETGVVTYSMYLQAKEAKRTIEARESDEYVSGTWEQ